MKITSKFQKKELNPFRNVHDKSIFSLSKNRKDILIIVLKKNNFLTEPPPIKRWVFLFMLK